MAFMVRPSGRADHHVKFLGIEVVNNLSFAWTTRIPLALIFLFTVGVSELMMKVSCNTLLQSLVTEEMRGRIMSLYTMAFRGTAPVGYIIGGILASNIGAPTTMMLSGVFCLISACWFLVHKFNLVL